MQQAMRLLYNNNVLEYIDCFITLFSSVWLQKINFSITKRIFIEFCKSSLAVCLKMKCLMVQQLCSHCFHLKYLNVSYSYEHFKTH